jgi:predicted dehydrogenase
MNRRTFLSATAVLATAGVLSRSPDTRAASRRYRACIIGDTDRGGYGHGLHQLWALRDDIDVVGLADPHENGRPYYGREAKAQRLYPDYREMLVKEKPDLVAIAPRWTIQHKEYLLACAEAGAHGIVEKPLTPDLAQADEVLRAIDAMKLKWAIAFNFRASPVVRHARKLVVEDGLIGRLLELRGRGKEDNRSGGEDLVVLGVHVFDLMRYFAGPAQWCEAEVLSGGRTVTPADVREATEPLGPIAGDTVHARYGFSGGVRGYFASVAGAEGGAGRSGLDLYGTAGVLTIRMTPVPLVRRFASPTWTGDNSTSIWSALPDEPAVAVGGSPVGHYKPIVDDLIDAIDKDRNPFTGLDAGRDALEMSQAVFETLPTPGRVPLPLAHRDHPLVRWRDSTSGE